MTIDERATSYIAENEYTEREECIAYAAYCAGAREQKSFNELNVEKFLSRNLAKYFYVKDSGTVSERTCVTPAFFEDFRKAMEDEQC